MKDGHLSTCKLCIENDRRKIVNAITTENVKCGMCLQVKSPDCFHRYKRGDTGLQGRCKECVKKSNSVYIKTDNAKMKISQASRKRRINNPEKYLLVEAIKRANKKGLKYELELSDIIIPKFCPALNIELVVGEGSVHDNSPTIDRIDSSKGYVKGNIQVISDKANRIKNDATIEELILIGNWARTQQKSEIDVE